MESRSFDAERYGQLLAEARPVVIETPEEHDRMLTVAEGLMEKGEHLSAEEERLLALVVLLIEAFEQTIEAEEDDDEETETAPEPPKPYETLRRLMEARGLDEMDVADLFGSPHALREILAGRREISKGQAKALAKYFRTPEKLFLS